MVGARVQGALRACDLSAGGVEMNDAFASSLATENGRRSLQRLLEPLVGSPGHREFIGSFASRGKSYSIPRFTIDGPNSVEPIRIGIFAAIHGDEPAG